TEHVDGVLLAHRRPRASGEREPWMAQTLTGPGVLAYDTDRARTLGRGRSVARPLAVEGPLAGTTGSVLDPVFCLRRTVTLPPGASTELVLGRAAASSRDEALSLMQRHVATAAVDAAFAAAVTGDELPADLKTPATTLWLARRSADGAARPAPRYRPLAEGT